MAPRRGGSGGGGGSFENRCSRVGAFEDDLDKAAIGVAGGILLLFFILSCCVISRSGKRKKAGQEKSILRWYQYGIALFLVLAWFILLIVNDVLSECGIIYSGNIESSAIQTAVIVTQKFTEMYLMGIILFVVVKRMFQLAGSLSLKRTMVILGGIFFAIVAIVFVAYMVILGLTDWGVNIGRTAFTTRFKLAEAYAALYLLLVIFAMVGLILAWVRLAKKPERKQGVTGWIPVLIICLLGFSVHNVVIVFLIDYDLFSLTRLGLTIGVSLALFFFFGAFFSVFMIARGKGWDFLHLPQDIQPKYSAPPPMGSPYTQSPYDSMLSPDGAKRMSYASHSTAPTAAPPYMGATGMAYSGNGVYEPQGQTYQAGGWTSGGYAPVGQVSTGYTAPVGAASREV
ncbi:hypothetical protein TWF718_006644 [Orbilia javanica]|uniref:Uncharacterized protein n=1 Tax=Orbilia javanica TaxID=47235 RepID=A0AAN8MS56_9PEZI